jgi:hypothetical protein
MTINTDNDTKYNGPIVPAIKHLDLTCITASPSDSHDFQYGHTATTCSSVLPEKYRQCSTERQSNKKLIAAVMVNKKIGSSVWLAHKASMVSDGSEFDMNTGHDLVTHYNPSKILTDGQ